MSILNIVHEETYFRVTETIHAHDVKTGLLLVEEVVNSGHDLREFVDGLNEHFRNLLVARTTGSTQLIETSDEYKKRYDESKILFSENDLLRFIKITGEIDQSIRWNQQPRLKLEMGMIKMIKMDTSIQIQDLLRQIEELKKNGSGSPQKELPITYVEERNPAQRPPVRGSVKATQPTLRADQIVPSFSQRLSQFGLRGEQPLSPAAIFPASAQSVSAAVPIVMISTDEAQAKWSSFVEEACRQRIAVGSMLRDVRLKGVDQDKLQINCRDSFQDEALKRNRQFLTDLAQKVYGAKVLLETLVDQQPGQLLEISSSEPASASSSQSHPASQANPAASPEATRKHPVVQAIIKQFGAVEVR
jgi:DNA polymerase-3 subunit gamma/tau